MSWFARLWRPRVGAELRRRVPERRRNRSSNLMLPWLVDMGCGRFRLTCRLGCMTRWGRVCRRMIRWRARMRCGECRLSLCRCTRACTRSRTATLATRRGRSVPRFARRCVASCLMSRGRWRRYLHARQSLACPRQFGVRCCAICTRGVAHRIFSTGTARDSLWTAHVSLCVGAHSHTHTRCVGGCVALHILAHTLREHAYVICGVVTVECGSCATERTMLYGVCAYAGPRRTGRMQTCDDKNAAPRREPRQRANSWLRMFSYLPDRYYV